MFLAGLAVAAIPFCLRSRKDRTKTPTPEPGQEQYGTGTSTGPGEQYGGTTGGEQATTPGYTGNPPVTTGEQYGS